MTSLKEYIEERRECRLIGEYDGRKPIYVNGEMSLNTALAIFEAAGKIERVGEPNVIKECVKGGRRVIWDKLAGWSVLEKRLNKQEIEIK